MTFVNKTRSCACKLIKVLTSLPRESEFFFFFFLTLFRKKWVGREMGNETFYWDGLIIINVVFLHRNSAT